MCSGISASLVSNIKECQASAAVSLIPVIIGLSSAGMAMIGKCSVAMVTALKRSNPLSSHAGAFLIYRRVKKRRKSAARVAVDPALAPNFYQPHLANPTWPPYVAGGYGDPSPPGIVLAKYPPFYTTAHHDAGIQKPAPGRKSAVYSTAPEMPGLPHHFYEGTAPPFVPTPPPSARQSPKAPPLASAAPSQAPRKPAGRRK